MATYVGGASANGTTVSLPAGSQAGDLAIVVAGRPNANGPGIPAGWNDLGVVSGGSGGSAHGSRLGWKVLEAADITDGTVGTWSNAAEILVGVYRPAAGSNLAVHGTNFSGTGANGTLITFPARTGLGANSWQIAVASHRAATAGLKDGAVTNYTNRSSGFTSERVGLWDSNGTTSGIAQQTLTVTGSSGNAGWTMEMTELLPTAVVGSDTALGDDTSVGTAGLTAADSATATDAAAPAAVFTTSDTAAGADTSTTSQGGADSRTTPPYQLPNGGARAATGTWTSTASTLVDDDPDNPDGSAVLLDGSIAGTVSWRFPAPSYTLDPAAGVLALRCRLNNPSGSPYDAKVHLLELVNAEWVVVATQNVTVPASTAAVYQLTFSRAALADQSGANVGVEVELLAAPL